MIDDIDDDEKQWNIGVLYLRDQEILSFYHELDPTFLFLFTSEDVYRSLGEAHVYKGHVNPPEERVRLTAPAAVLQDRLDVLGIGRTTLQAYFIRHAAERLKFLLPFRDTTHDTVQPEIELLKKITLDTWIELLIAALKPPGKRDSRNFPDPMSVEGLLSLWNYIDPRYTLGAVLLACQPDDEVSLDISDLNFGFWRHQKPFDPQQLAIRRFGYSLYNGSPPVIITEGSTDARFLQSAIRVRYPHLQSYIKFFDFDDGAEGSAAAGIRTLKSFAAADISNRVVLLLDNDTAAHDAVRALKTFKLPDHYSVLHYPGIELARSYPTLGPSGLSAMNVNGLAGSIELYLGVDSLTGPDGKLSPVQWRTYIAGIKAYQGEVTNKAEVQKRFREKAKKASADPSVIASQDWSGMDAIIGGLINVLRS